MEAKYKIVVHTTTELIWLHKILTELGLQQTHTITLFYDNQSVLKMTKIPVFYAQTNT